MFSKFQNVTIKRLFMVLILIVGVLMAAMSVMQIRLAASNGELTEAYQTRYRSYLLADELRQSSDDLTRLARTYVVTGDARYEQQYLDILSIRGGAKPRPEAYERIYWDFVAANDSKPRPDSD